MDKNISEIKFTNTVHSFIKFNKKQQFEQQI